MLQDRVFHQFLLHGL